MLWRAVLICSKAMHGLRVGPDPSQNCFVSLFMNAMLAPCCHNQSGLARNFYNPSDIFRTVWRWMSLHHFRIRGSEGKCIRHAHCSEAPLLREVDAPSDSWIVFQLIRRGRIQPDELNVCVRCLAVLEYRKRSDSPFSPERVAVNPIR